jgi:hypothetical protein
VNLSTTRRKLAEMLRTFRFGTVRDVLARHNGLRRLRLNLTDPAQPRLM